MADYAIGDIQGCYDPLMRLLDHIHFDESRDRLWLVGDLVNRGPQSLEVLRFLKSLPQAPVITLGNHDLHLLSALFGGRPLKGEDDTLDPILQADDGEELGHWLRQQKILAYDADLKVVMSHAGIAPHWDLPLARQLAAELEQVLGGNAYTDFLPQLYGNEPHCWRDDIAGLSRLRLITNYFTRMRFCDKHGGLVFHFKGSIQHIPPGLYPWYAVPSRIELDVDIVFGHWAALMGQSPKPHIHALDTGCIWGGQLTALRLQDRQRFAVPGLALSKAVD